MRRSIDRERESEFTWSRLMFKLISSRSTLMSNIGRWKFSSRGFITRMMRALTFNDRRTNEDLRGHWMREDRFTHCRRYPLVLVDYRLRCSLEGFSTTINEMNLPSIWDNWPQPRLEEDQNEIWHCCSNRSAMHSIHPTTIKGVYLSLSLSESDGLYLMNQCGVLLENRRFPTRCGCLEGMIRLLEFFNEDLTSSVM